MRKKVFRVTTVPISLKVLMKNQLRYLNNFFDVYGVSSDGPEILDVKKNEGIKVIVLPMKRAISLHNDIVSLFRMILLLIKQRPIIIHSHTPKAGFISMFAAWITKVPIRLHTVAGLPMTSKKGIERNILKFVEIITYKFATKIYSNSRGLKLFLIQENMIKEEKIKILGNGSTNGIDLKYFKPQNSKSNDNKKFRFIFIGRLVGDKGVNELITVFERLNKKINSLSLYLIGEQEKELDPLSNKTIKIIKNNKSIKSFGYVNDIRNILSSSNCLVLPSHREGFPNVLLQAMAMNIPAITTDINGCNEIIKDSINGVLIRPKNFVDLYNSMEKIHKDKEFYESLKGNCRNSVLKFDSSKMHYLINKEYQSHLRKI